MSQNDFEGVFVLKHHFGISVTIRNYITACAQLCAPDHHSSLMLPSLHSLRACSTRSAAEWVFGGVLGQNSDTTISLALCRYITTCAWLCAPVDHSCLTLPSSHSIMACSGRYAKKSFVRLCQYKNTILAQALCNCLHKHAYGVTSLMKSFQGTAITCHKNQKSNKTFEHRKQQAYKNIGYCNANNVKCNLARAGMRISFRLAAEKDTSS